MTQELLEAVPTGRSIWAVGSTLNGVTLSAPDVGGTAGMQQTYMATHGSDRRDNAVQVDGMSVNGIEGDGAIQNYFNQGMFEEISYQTSALVAELPSAGVRVNMVPKDGSNSFRGSLFYTQTPSSFQSSNFTPELAALGLKAPNRVQKIIDVNPSFGGPLLRSKLWFFSSARFWGVDQTVTDSFINADATQRTFQPDQSRPTVDDNLIKSGMLRLTYQMSPKHKFATYYDGIVKFRGHECAANTFPTAEACGIRSPKRYWTGQLKYTGTVTNNLLFEGGWSVNDETYSTNEIQDDTPATNIGRLDRITTDRWSSVIGPYYFRSPVRHTFSGAASYVTGSHALKVGFQLGKGWNHHQRTMSGGIDFYQEYNNKVPVSVFVHNTPQDTEERIAHDLGVYIQDSLRFNRLTLNPGIRFEFFNTYVPEQSSPAGQFVPARTFAKIENLPSWSDYAPRLGVVYDVFGNSRTAVKFHAGKYMRAFSTVGFAQVYNPNVLQTDRRTWSDLNGDDVAQPNEIGPVVTPFNISGVSNRRPDPDIRRPYQWEYSAGVQHELFPGVLVSANWLRRDYKRLFWSDNILVSHSDYTIVNIPNPYVCRGDGADLQPQRGEARAGRDHRQELVREPALVQRLRRRLHRAGARRQLLRRRDRRKADHGLLRGRRSEQPAVLRSARPRHALPDAVQARRHLPAAVGDRRERQLAGPAGRARRHGATGRRVRARRKPGARPVAQRRVHREPDPDPEPHRGQCHGAAHHTGRAVPRPSQPDRRASDQERDDLAGEAPGAVRHLQSAERQHDPEPDRDLRIGAGPSDGDSPGAAVRGGSAGHLLERGIAGPAGLTHARDDRCRCGGLAVDGAGEPCRSTRARWRRRHPAAGGRRAGVRPDVQPRHRPDRLQRLRVVPSSRRTGAIPAHHLRRGAAACGTESRR